MMKTTMGRLRRLIREAGLDTDLLNMAGTCGGMGANSDHRDREAIMNPAPDLGNPEDEENGFTDDEWQQKNQPGVRVGDRAGDTGGSVGVRRVR